MTRVTWFIFVYCWLSFVPSSFGEEFNGVWWNKVSRERQLGFLAGESDCHVYELRGEDWRSRSIYQAVDILDRFYEDAGRRKILVIRALKMIEIPQIKRPEGGEIYPEKHGYYDGEWWHTSGLEHGGVGFVEGYISCLPQGRKLYPKAPYTYAVLIDKWYRKNKPKDSMKIADVLIKFSASSLKRVN